MEPREKLRLMRIRELKKQKSPPFKRVESWRYVKVKDSWRKPRGIDNKSRKHKKSGVKSPNPGYRTPKAVRNLHPSGLKDIVITHIEELDGLNPREYGVRINSRLGGRKRVALIEAAVDRGFKVFNIALESTEAFEEFAEEIESAEESFEEEEMGDEEEDSEETLDEDNEEENEEE